MTRSHATASLVRRHLGTGTGAPATVAALIALLAALAVLVPPAVGALLDASTRYRLETLSPAVRDLSTSFPGVPGVGSGASPSETLPEEYRATWGTWDSALQHILDSASDDIRTTHTDADYFSRLGAPGMYAPTTYVGLDPRYASRIAIVEGRMPLPTATDQEWVAALRQLFDEFGQPVEPAPVSLPATEIVLSAASAAKVGWELGETRVVGAEARWALPIPLTLVGTFAAVDDADPYWTRATGILAPSIGSDPDGVEYVRTTAYAPPEALGTVAYLARGRLTDAWYALRTDEVTADAAPRLVADLRAFTATAQLMPSGQAGIGIPSLAFQSGAIPALDSAIAQSGSFVAVLAMLAAGPLGVAAAVLVLGCRMILEHRRPSVELLTARGASPGQLRSLLGLEGLIVGVVPATAGVILGLVVAAWLIPEVRPPSAAVFVVPIALALLPAAVAVASATRSRSRARADAPELRSRWRPVVEGALVAVAVLATVTLLVRGVGGELDPLVVVAPLLLALVACLVALRVYPAGLRVLLRRERGGRGFVGMLGAARALRDPATGLAPVLALIVGVSFAVTGGVLLSTLQAGTTQAARASVGADLQLSSLRFEDGAAEAVAGIDGVAQVAPVAVLSSSVLLADAQRNIVSLYLVDRPTFDEVQEGYPAAVPEEVSLGDGTGPVPLYLSADVAARTRAPVAVLQIGRAPAEFAGASQESMPFSPTRSWALADIAYAEQIDDRAPVTVRLLVRLEPGADPGEVAADAQELLGGGVRVSTPAEALAEIEQDPATIGLRWALIAGIALSAVLAAVAVVMTLVLGGRSRRRILALLQTLGAPPRSGTGLVAWELAPATVAALVVGTAFGAALPLLLLGVVDLTPFTGGDTQPPYAADPLVLLLAVGGFVAVTGIFTLLALAITRRARAAAVLRTVEET